jgi:acetyl esterase
MAWFWERYVPDPGLHTDPSVALLRAAGEPGGLDGLPPAVVATAELDILRDEGQAYAAALEAAGVAVRRLEGAGLVHGYFGLAAASAAARAEGDRALDALGDLLAT